MSTECQTIAELLKELCEQKKRPFPQRRQPLTGPESHGVYIIRRNDTVLHVGKTSRAQGGLQQRLRDHLYGNSSFVRDDLNGQGATLRETGYTYQFLVEQDARTRALLEALATGTLCPGISALAVSKRLMAGAIKM